MGFRLGRTYSLEFEAGTYLAGAEITLRSASVDTVLAVEEMTADVAFPLFIDHVVSWNLEDADGNALPIDVKAAYAIMEVPVQRKLVNEWYRAATGISTPLDPRSNDGEESQTTEAVELSIPMEVL